MSDWAATTLAISHSFTFSFCDDDRRMSKASSAEMFRLPNRMPWVLAD